MLLCFVPAGCLADSLLVIPCCQRVCGCVLSLLDVWLILCLSFLALRMYVVVFCLCSIFCLPMLTIFLFLLSGGLSSCLILLEISFNRFPFIFLGCKWPNIICCSFS